MMRHALRAAAAAALFAIFGCRPAPSPAPTPTPPDAALPDRPAPATKTIRFTDVTADSGIDFIPVCGTLPSQEILEVNGGGLALIDFDGDGDQDLFVTSGATMDAPAEGTGCRLFENLGNLQFRDVTAASDIEVTTWATGVAVGDADGDGHDDLYICAFGPDVLLRNRGDGTFEDVTAAAGLGDERWSTSAAFADLDADGDLDLFVVNYVVFDPANPPERARHKGITVMNGPHGLPGQHDVLYENLGDGTFRDVSEPAGVLVREPSYGLNLAILDFDGDGRLDVLVGNDSMANFLYYGTETPLRFDERGAASGASSNMDGGNQATMGIAIGDVDGNGYADVFTTNFANDTNTLHMNRDGRTFDDRTQSYGLGLVSRPFLGWAAWFADFDHDGDEDLISFNGHVYPEASYEMMDSPYEQTALLFARDGRRFKRVKARDAGAWLDAAHRDRTAAFGDLDGDGDVDIIVGELNGPVRVLRNETADGTANWLIVALEDARPGVHDRAGHGAQVVLTVGDVVQRRWIIAGGGFQSSSAPEAHFGRPPGARVEGRLEVIWPDGLRQRVAAPVGFGRRVTVTRE